MRATPLARELRTRQRQALETYRANRRFKDLGVAELEDRFVAAVRAWCANHTDPNDLHIIHPESARALNEVSAEYLLRQQPVPTKPIIEHLAWVLPCFGEGYRGPKAFDGEPVTAIAVVIFRDSSPPGMSFIYAPFCGGLMGANPDGERALQPEKCLA